MWTTPTNWWLQLLEGDEDDDEDEKDDKCKPDDKVKPNK
jgi:hypothetical protein